MQTDAPPRPAFLDSAAGAKAEALVGLLNAGDQEAIVNFVNDSYAPEFRAALRMEQHVAVLEMALRDYPALELRSVTELSDTKLQA